MSNTRDTGFLRNAIQVTDQGVTFVSGSTTLMSISSSGAVTTTGVISGSNALSASFSLNSALLNGIGSVGFATTGALLEVSSSQQQISSSQQQISASLLNVVANYATTGSNSFRANQSITGSLVVSSTITAQTLVVQTVTSSIVYSSGSNLFGSQLSNTQTFTGSIYQTGSIAAFAGSVGIGTNSPSQQLSLGMGANSTTKTYTTDNQGTLSFYNLTTGNLESYLDIASVRSGNDATLGGSNIRFLTQTISSTALAIERMRITSTGNVGIGTNNPLSLLHIEGNAEGAGYTTYQNFLFLKNTNTAGGAVPGVNLFVAAESDALGVEFVSNGTVTSNGSAVVKGYASRSSGHFRITNLSTSGSEFIFRTAVAGSTTQVNRMYIDSSGNTTFSGTIVGGGTITVPSDVSAAGGYKINYTSADAGSRSWKIANDNAAYGDFWIGQSTTQAGSSYSIKLYISTAGNVGIGTASPASQATGQTTGILDVSAAAGGNLVLHRTSGGDTALFSILKASNGTYIDSAGAATAANNAIYFRTNNINADQTSLTTALTITSGGVVGIGATPASQSGGAYAGSTEMAGILRIQGTGRYFTSGDGLEISKSAIYSYNRATSAYNDLGINDAMIIRGAGNVLIGTSTDYGGKIQSRHDGNGVGSTYSGVHIMNSSSAIGAGVAARLSFNADGGSYQYGIIEQRRDGGDTFWIKTQGSGNGNIYVQANTNGVYVAKDSTSWTSNSDERLKNIVGNIENAVESLNTLRTVKHTWKSDKTNKEYYALIAQDVEKVLPNVIDKSKLGNGDDTEYLGVRYTELVPVLVKAIKELKLENDSLKEILQRNNIN